MPRTMEPGPSDRVLSLAAFRCTPAQNDMEARAPPDEKTGDRQRMKRKIIASVLATAMLAPGTLAFAPAAHADRHRGGGGGRIGASSTAAAASAAAIAPAAASAA